MVLWSVETPLNFLVVLLFCGGAAGAYQQRASRRRRQGDCEASRADERAKKSSVLKASVAAASSASNQAATSVAEQALRRLPDGVFQQAIEHAAGGLVICDAQQSDMPILYVSPSFENLTGYPAEEAIGQNCRFLQGNKTQQLGLREIRQAIAAGKGCKVLLQNYRKSGQPFWNELTLSPIVNEAGEVTHYVGSQVDISHYLETFKALQQSEARYRHLYEETPAMLHSVDGQGRITSTSRYWLEKLGYEKSDVIDQPLSAFVAPGSRQKVSEIFAALKTETVDRDRLCQFIKKDGTTMDVLLSSMARATGAHSLNPQEGSTLGVLVDITERKKAKEKLRRNAALLRAINNLPPTGIFVMDCHTNEALFVNSEFYRIWQLEHLKEKVVVGHINGEQLLTECLSNIDLGQFVATATAQDFAHGNKIIEDEVPLLDGRTLRRIYGPIQENSVTFAYLYMFEDITERKQAVQELALATEAAEAANRAKSEFLANMSHELRSPLNAILGFTHILQTDSPRAAQKEHLDIIYRSSEHLLALINDVLDISKIEAGQVVLTYSEFDLYRLIDELQQMFSGVVAEKGLILTVERSPQLPRIVYSDRLKLRQILINLMSNAVKFTSIGSITLSVAVVAVEAVAGTTAADDSDNKIGLSFTVADTGTGIAPEDQERLFEAFVQTRSGLSAHEGTGLGLTISHEYIQLLGGELSVNSAVGKGAEFSFMIEVQPVENSLALESEAVPKGQIVGLAPGQPSYRVLVVDDVALNRRLLVHLLGNVGFEVKEASDGKEAIALWQSWRPQLIWMDVHMPVMNGEDAAMRIRSLEDGNRTCIIALTANAFTEDRTQALASGCDDFVSKPIQAAEIFERMAQHLGVTYQYEEKRQPTAPITSAPLTCRFLRATAPGWRYALAQAALDLDEDKMLALVAELPASQRELADAISRQIEEMAYQKILALLQEADAVSP